MSSDKETAQMVMQAATGLFAQMGYDGVSVRDICRTAQVSDNAVHYHFKSKSRLYQTIVHQFGRDMLQSAQRLLEKYPDNPQALETQLELFIKESLSIFLDNRDLLKIAFTEFVQLMPRCDEEVALTFLSHHELVSNYFREAQNRNLLRKNLDPEIISSSIFESIAMRVLECQASKIVNKPGVHEQDFREHWIQQQLNIFLYGCLNKNS